MDFWRKNWRVLVAASSLLTLPFMAKELLAVRLKDMLEMGRETFLQIKELRELRPCWDCPSWRLRHSLM